MEKIKCQHCGKEKKEKDIYRLSYRYTDKKRTYNKSQKRIIHTGYKLICPQCIKIITR